jgi:Protein of unknown function DUF84
MHAPTGLHDYLGQLVPVSVHGSTLAVETSWEIKKLISQYGGINGRKVEVYVTSKNNLKIEAVKDAVMDWIKNLFGQNTMKLTVQGYGVSSGIDEQPHGLAHTFTGAQNRLDNMKIEMAKIGLSRNTEDGTLRILISLENGIMLENVKELKNSETFLAHAENVWVDRCVVKGQILFEGKAWSFDEVSEGVTTPVQQVQQSLWSDWKETAGSYISKKYGSDPANWHEKMAGKGRQIIMQELVKASLGLPFSFPVPKKTRSSESIPASAFHQYKSENVQFFTRAEIERLIEDEISKKSQGIPLASPEEGWIRDFLASVPQPSKKTPEGFQRILGPDGHTPLYMSGPALTEDLMIGYFDEVKNLDTQENQQVFHLILLWNKEEKGWVLPGKRDRAYDKNEADISVKDAYYSLMMKEIGIERSDVAYCVNLSLFDDRLQDDRMQTFGALGLMVLNFKPALGEGKIGVPLNVFVQLARREIAIPPVFNPFSHSDGYMARNHDSMIVALIQTTAFYQSMEKVRLAHANFCELLKTNPNAKRPPLPPLDAGLECPLCLELQIKPQVICSEGHSICSICLPIIATLHNCPECRGDIFPKLIPNRALDQLAKGHYPPIYAERHKKLTGEEPLSWINDPAFIGSHIQY